MPIGDENDSIDSLIDEVRQWAAGTRASQAADARSRERWLRRQAADETTLSGLAVDLAERGEPVVVRTTSGRAHRGRLVGVGQDVWVLRSEAPGETTFLAANAVTSLRAQPGAAVAAMELTGARQAPTAPSMAQILTDLAAEHPRVRVTVTGEPDPIVGQLRSVGVDLAILRLASRPPQTVYVRLGSVSELSVLGSG